MKLHYNIKKLNYLVLFITTNLLLVSCGTYQSVYNDDGIYGETLPENQEKKVMVVSQKEYKDYEDNYFSKRLDELQNIDNDEIFTDVDSYYYDDQIGDEEIIDGDVNYSASQPWGFEDNDVIVNINLNNNPFWGGFGRNWGFNVFAVGGWNNPWGWRRGFGRNYGFNTWAASYNAWGFIDPYAGIGVWNVGYLHPFLPNFGITGFRHNRYSNSNIRYGRRNTLVANNTIRRNRNSYSRVRTNTNRRVAATSRRASNTIKRNSNIRPVRRRATVSRNGSSTRRISSTRGNSSTRRSSSTIRRGNSSSRSRSSNARRSGSSSRNRSSSASTSSSRSRSSSTRSSSSSSRSRSSSTRSSGSSSRSSGSTSRRSSSRRGN